MENTTITVYVAVSRYADDDQVDVAVFGSLEAATEAVMADVLAQNNEDLEPGEEPMDADYVFENDWYLLDPEDPQAGFVYRDAPAFWDTEITVTRQEVK